MTLNYFMYWVKSRWNRKPREADLAIMALGLCGEAGEVVEHIKKQIRGSKPVDVDAITLELGDVLHYWCCICAHFNIDPSDVMRENINKLNAREAARAAPDPVPPADVVLYDEYARAPRTAGEP